MVYYYGDIMLIEFFTTYKKSIRIIGLKKYDAHAEPLFKSFKLLKVADIFKLQQLKFYFNLINKKQPGYLDNFDFTQNHQLHKNYTRSSNNFHTLKIKHIFATKCLRFSLPTLSNNTPQCITDKYFTHSLDGFARYAKNYMINNYCYQCTIATYAIITNYFRIGIFLWAMNL